MFKNNNKLRKVMLVTTIIGIFATIVFVIIFNIANYEGNLELMTCLFLLPFALYVAEYLIIGYGFKRKFGKERMWVANLCFLPGLVEIFGVVIINAIIGESPILITTFAKWYSMIGVTISVLIYEYKFLSYGKK